MKLLHVIILSVVVLFFKSVEGKAGRYLYTPDVFNGYCSQSLLDRIYSGKETVEAYCNTDDTHNLIIWSVYSDRERNTVYYGPKDDTRKSQTLEFMEPLVVSEVKGNRLHVYRLVGTVNEESQEVGWVDAANLVLSSYAMLNHKGIPQKAMNLISFADIARPTSIDEQVNKFRLYHQPNTNGTSISDSGQIGVYYILKRFDGMCLLSKSDLITNQQKRFVKTIVHGWMPNIYLTDWDNRLCLEPSTNVEDYGNMDIPVFLSSRALDDSHHKGSTTISGSVINHRVRTNSPDPNVMRMPVLNILDNGKTFHVAAVGTMNPGLDLESIALAQSQSMKARRRLENVNFLFVVDATESMKPYYPAIARSIEGIIRSSQLLDAGIKLRFGALIYRDYADGDKSYEVLPCTGDNERVVDFINGRDCGSLGKEPYNAQYNAIVNGIDRSGFVRGQSNVVVLIGGAGNPANDKYNRSDVVKKLVEYDVSMMAIQVINGLHQAFADFNYDTKRFLFEKASTHIKKQGIGKLKVQFESVMDADVKNTFELAYTDKNKVSYDYFAFDQFTFTPLNEPVNETALEKHIVSYGKKYIGWLSKLLIAAEGLLNTREHMSLEVNANVVVDELCLKLALSDEECQILVNQVDHFSFEGYTSTRFYNKPSPAYVQVVFLSRNEFADVKRILVTISNASLNRSNRIKAFQDVLVQQVMILTETTDKAMVKDMAFDQAYEVLFGVEFDIHGRHRSLAKVSLDDLKYLRRKDSELLDDFITSLQNTARSFDETRYRDRRFEMAGQVFYWIPLKRFPGNE